MSTTSRDSTALWSDLNGEPYLTGPLARLNLNHEHLPPAIQRSLKATGLQLPSNNMFHSLIARALEIELVIHEAINILQDYEYPSAPCPQPETERRGLLWHE